MSERKTALVYVRKSFVKAGGPAPASPEMQAQACERALRELGLEPELHVDAKGHLSGKNEDRPAWQTVRKRLHDPDVAVLAVYTWNRAVRNAKLLLALVDELDDLGIRFIAVQNNIDTSTAAGHFQLTVMAAADEYESNVASERRVETIEHLRRVKGRHYGLPPFGTERKAHEGDLVLFASEKSQPNGSDHAALKHIYELYGGGHETIYTLSKRLNREGWSARDRNGQLKPWSVDDVRRVLTHYWIYAGYVPIGKGREREVIRGSHSAILPEALTTPVAAR